MAEERIRMPSGMGGLTIYHEESTSRIKIKPEIMVAGIIIIAISIILLHVLGASWLSP